MRIRVIQFAVLCVVCAFCTSNCIAFDISFICPQPKRVAVGNDNCLIPYKIKIAVDANAANLARQLLVSELSRYVAMTFDGTEWDMTLRFAAGQTDIFPQGYRLAIQPKEILIWANDCQGFRNGAITLLWLVRGAAACQRADKGVSLRSMVIEDSPDTSRRGMDLQLCFSGPDADFMYDSVRSLAMLKYNVIMPDLGLFYMPQTVATSKEAASHLPPKSKPIDRTKFREWVRFCEKWGLEVIPKVNCLGHSERGVPWVSAFGRGLDIDDERNYDVIYAIIDAYIEDCPNIKYICIGMDEAVDSMRENSKKYDKPAYELLAEHINKVVAYCKKRNVIPIVYHDMLLGEQEKIYWREGVANGTELETYRARALIPKSVVIDYWNYEGFERYRTVENFQKEGFEVWLTPWAGASVRTMGQNAPVLGSSVIGSTWIDCTYTDSFEFGGKYRIFYTTKWLHDAISNLAAITWNSNAQVKQSFDMGFDAGLVTASLYWDRPVYQSAQTASVKLPKIKPGISRYVDEIFKTLKLKSEKYNFKGLDFEIDKGSAVVLGNVAPVDVRAVMSQPKPWSIVIDGKKCAKISGINKVRASNECVLYTRDFGRSTRTSQYGTEAVIRCGQTHYCDTWGVGNNSIPRNGYVLSGQGGYNLYSNGGESYDNEAFSGYHTVGLVDANDDEVALGSRPLDGASQAKLVLKRKASSLVFLHTTAYEAAHYMDPMATIEIVYADGGKAVCQLRYGRDICSYDDVCFLYGKKDMPERWLAYADYGQGLNDGVLLYAYQWKNPESDREILGVNFYANDLGARIGYVVLSMLSIN
ncbi:MAG: hypothetical protein A2Y12_08980 [Planctomycetes bacterium GWF2_42_9]|nr:MAG: hypothetical protein A2Y12_08980 [Planctomycetes bacterium GWF2_42_9]